MFKGQHDLTKQDLIYLKLNNQNHKIDLRDKPFGNKDKIVPYTSLNDEYNYSNKKENYNFNMNDIDRQNVFSEEDMLKNLNFDQTFEEEVDIQNVHRNNRDDQSSISVGRVTGVDMRNTDTESDLDRKNRLLQNINSNYTKTQDRGLKTSQK